MAPDGNERGKTETFIISAVIFAIFEGAALYCSEIAGALTGYFLVFVHWISLCCFVAGPFGVWHEMVIGENARQRRNRIWALFVVSCFFNVFVAYGVWHPAVEPKKHLTLYVHTTDSPDVILKFTNSFLFFKTDKHGFTFPKNLPFLVVDVARTAPQVILKFGLFNDSARRFSSSALDVEKPEIDLWIANPDPGETLKWNADPKWAKMSGDKNFPGQILAYKFPDSLPAGTGDLADGITFNMQEKPSGASVVAVISGRGVAPVTQCFKLVLIPSDETVSKLRFDTNEVVRWNWKYRPVAYRPIDTPLIVSPSRVQLSDGTNTFGTEVMVSNPGSSNLYALTLSVEIENGTVPINSPLIELSKPKQRENAEHGELEIMFEASMDFIGYSQSRLFVIPVLQANEHRTFWIRGTILTNSFADISVWQSMNSFPDIKYTTNGMWMWPVLSTNSPWWIHIGGQPMDLGVGIMAWRGIATNGFTNDSQIIPSHP